MGTGSCRKVTQREFLGRVAGGSPVRYRFPAVFQVAALGIETSTRSAARFLERLGGVLTFDAYDTLAREVWVTHIREGLGARGFRLPGSPGP